MAKASVRAIKKQKLQRKVRQGKKRSLQSATNSPSTLIERLGGRLDDERLSPTQRRELAAQIGQTQGNQRLQRAVATLRRHGAAQNLVIQRDLKTTVGGDWAAALTQVAAMYSGAGGVIDRQKDAVRNFCDFAAEKDQPSLAEEMILGAINMILGYAMGGLGTAFKSVAAKVLSAAGVKAAAPAAGTEGAAKPAISVDGIIDKMIDKGKEKLKDSVKSAYQGGGGSQPTTLTKFKETELQALSSIAQEQILTLTSLLGQLRATPGEEDEWMAVNALFEAFSQNLTYAYQESFNRMTDTWFTMQVGSIGPGVRQGVLRVYLTDRYPDKGGFSVKGGDITGSGSNENIRSRLGARNLKNIRIPKVISMDGSMGSGILDCSWYLKVTGGGRPSSQPTISAPTSGVERLMSGSQDVVGYGGNKDGFAWLAAYHLKLQDLDTDDARNTQDNQDAGASEVWEAIKNLTPGTLGASTWS